MKTHCKNGHEFTSDNTRWITRDGGKRSRVCRICNNTYHSKYRRDNHNNTREVDRKAKLKAKYNLTTEAWQILFDKQDGRCAGCGVSFEFETPCVDHSHYTQLVRGLLCHSCNRGIGLLKDSPELLEKLAGYIRNAHRTEEP